MDDLPNIRHNRRVVFRLLISWFPGRTPGQTGFSLLPMPQGWPMLAGCSLGQYRRLAPDSHESGVGDADLKSARQMSPILALGKTPRIFDDSGWSRSPTGSGWAMLACPGVPGRQNARSSKRRLAAESLPAPRGGGWSQRLVIRD